MLTVNDDVVPVESELSGGSLVCPGCAGALAPWGWARERSIRHGVGADMVLVRHRPRRARCGRCGSTHVLLSVNLAARRADTAAVIAAAVEAKTVSGAGHRKIAAMLGRPLSTVRGWLRAFAVSAGPLAEAFTAFIHRDGPDAAALWAAAAPTPAGQAVSAVMGYAAVLGSRFGIATVPWQTAGLAGAGPWFFSEPWWAFQVQHELALMPGPAGGKGGISTG